MASFYRINREKIKEAEEAIENQYIDGRRGINIFPDIYFSDNLEETLKKILDVFDSAEEFEAPTSDRELKEVTNFNETTIKQLKPFFERTFIYGHGTVEEESAKSIIEQGLKMKSVNILSTAIPLDFSEKTFEYFKKWPHLRSRYIVLIGISDEIIPCIKEAEKSNGYNTPYLMDRSRIIGYIDSVTQEFIPSPYYSETQEYNPDYPYFIRMSYNTNANSFIKANFLLFMLESLAERKEFTTIPYENESVRKETFVAIYLQIKDAIRQIKQTVQEKGITRKEYEEEQARSQKENFQETVEAQSPNDWTDEDIDLESIDWIDEDIDWDDEAKHF